MSSRTLNLMILAGTDRPDVREAWSRLEPVLAGCSGVRVVGVYSHDDPIHHQEKVDVVVVLGGDGSILRGCRQLGDEQRPMMGINLGRLGFLADVTPEQFVSSLDVLKRGDYEVVDHLMLKSQHHHADGTMTTDMGLNEVMVTSGGSLKMLDVNLTIDDRPVTTFSCDGLIISTPVGSTAHNLSAGGPILRQDLQAVCITPICPHSLTVRPIVDSAERTYELTVTDPPDGVMVVIDGQTRRPLRTGERIQVTRHSSTFQLVRLPGHSYYGTLHRKLRWGGQPQYRE